MATKKTNNNIAESKQASKTAAAEQPDKTFEDAKVKLYVDKPLKMQIGPFVSKIAFGSEDALDDTPAELVLTISTAELLELATGIYSMLGQDKVRNGMAKQIKHFLTQVAQVPPVKPNIDSPD